MRTLVRVLLAVFLLAGFGSYANAQLNEVNKDRPGNDISIQNIGANPALCAQNCAAIGACRAWTYVKPGVQGPSARCYLKSAAPAQVNNNCCVSGVKLTGAIPPGAASGADRPGGNYASSVLATPNPTTCANQCGANPNCKAWTFVKPGIQGAQARCYLKNIVPVQVANSCCISGVSLPPPPAPIPPGAQVNKDRPGNNYASFNLAAADAALCQNACNGQAQCQAWTYVKPGVQGPQARCYLKTPTPVAVNDNCCISGVKPPPPPALPPGAQANRDRPGSDFNNIAIAAADPNVCYNACNSVAQCQAWTYVKPGVQGPSARCYLKNAVPVAVVNNCCVSGVKAGPPPVVIPPGAQAGKNRPGGDYAISSVVNPTICANACDGQAQCQAWSWAEPGVEAPAGRCHLKNIVPSSVNNIGYVSGVKAAAPVPPGAVNNRNRPGNNYSNFVPPTQNAVHCQDACDADGNCTAWTYVRPGNPGPNARCFLKNPTPAQVVDTCCVSGVKAAPPPPGPSGPFEIGVNRPGGDYADFSGTANSALLCLGACALQPWCKAWTFVSPGYQGPNARCWLKSTVPPPIADACCTSGVK